MKQLMEKNDVVGRNLYRVFVDFEKAFDRVPKEVIWWSLRRKVVLEREIKAIMEMYTNIETSVMVECTSWEPFHVKSWNPSRIDTRSSSVCVDNG